jgi:hypothetical protein
MNPDNLVKYQLAKVRSAKDPDLKQVELERLKLVLELAHPETKSLTYSAQSAQEDASEFLVPALESLYEKSPLLEESKLTPLEKVNQYKAKAPKVDNKYTIELPILGNRSNMSTLLNDFQREEIMAASESPKYVQGRGVESQYENGQDQLKTKKKLSLSVTEDTTEIVVSTKRFQQNIDGTRAKIHNAVKLSNIEIPVSGKQDGSKAKFEPTAFIVHSGEFGGGHYFAFIKERDRSGKEAWYEYNDSAKPREITESEQCIPSQVVEESVSKAMGIDPNLPMSLLELRKQQAYIVKYSSPNDRGVVDLPVRNQDERFGSVNLGNTCWANSAAAFLSSFQSFQKYQNITLDDEEKRKLQEVTSPVARNVKKSKKAENASDNQSLDSSLQEALQKSNKYKQEIENGVTKPSESLSQTLRKSNISSLNEVNQKDFLALLIESRKSNLQDEMFDGFDASRYNKKEISIFEDLDLMPDKRLQGMEEKFEKALKSKSFQDKVERYKGYIERGEVKPSDAIIEMLSGSKSGYRDVVKEMNNEEFTSILCYSKLFQECGDIERPNRKSDENKYEKEIFADLGLEQQISQSSDPHLKKSIKRDDGIKFNAAKKTFIIADDPVLISIKESIKAENLPPIDEFKTFKFVAQTQDRLARETKKNATQKEFVKYVPEDDKNHDKFQKYVEKKYDNVEIKSLEKYGGTVSLKTLELVEKESQNKDKIVHNKLSNALRKLIDGDAKKNKSEIWKSLTTLDRRVLVDHYNNTSGDEIDFISLFKQSSGNQKSDLTIHSQNYVIDDSKENMKKLDKILNHSLSSIPSGVVTLSGSKKLFETSISR